MNKNIIPLMGFECENAKIQGRLKRLLREFEERYKERSLISVFAFLEHAKSLKIRRSWFIFHEWELIKTPINGVNLPISCNLLSHNEQRNVQDFEGNSQETEQELNCYGEEPCNNYKNTSKYKQVIDELSKEWAIPFNTVKQHTTDWTFTQNPDLPAYAILELIRTEFEPDADEPEEQPHFFNKKASEPLQDQSLPTVEPSLASQLFSLLLAHYGTSCPLNSAQLAQLARTTAGDYPQYDAETLLPIIISSLDTTT
jgi:hypothetical protein